MQLYKNFKPDVSIILPTFNRINYLERSINSVINQTFKNWELLIIDDGSEDKTFELANKFLMNDERIKYLKHQNKGLPISLNTGIQISSGKYLTFLGSDDEYKLNHLELRISEIEKNPNVDCLFGGLEIIGDEFVKDKNDLTKLVHLNDCAVGGTFFGKREMFIAMKGFRNINYAEDSDFYDIAKISYNFKKVNFPTYIYYRNTPDSICNNV
ncbi:MAG: glycosyltransferase family 2 protein [Ignavibacteriae bacterium]|nr:glycosyltransferase family 2 protein [Ignavibacteriota bacterium]